MRMNQIKFLLSGLVLSMFFTSCSLEADFGKHTETQTGHLVVKNLTANAVYVETRALVESDYKNTDNYSVVVTDVNGEEKLNCKGSELTSMQPLTLPIGNFTVKAFYGKEHAASRDEFYVLGEVVGIIKADQTEAVNVTCSPTCGRIKVNFSSEMQQYFEDYSVDFTGTKALGSNKISWLKNDVEPWYVKLEKVGEEILFEVSARMKDAYVNEDQQHTTQKSGKFTLARNRAYTLNVNPKYTPGEQPGEEEVELNIEIVIDEGTNDQEYDIEVPVTWI